MGGAKAQLTEVLAKAEPLFKRLSDKYKKNNHEPVETPAINAEGNECG